jgi:hypothetical protein
MGKIKLEGFGTKVLGGKASEQVEVSAIDD